MLWLLTDVRTTWIALHHLWGIWSIEWMGIFFGYQRRSRFIEKRQGTLGSFGASCTSTPFCGSHVQHFTDVRWSYLSSSRSSVMESFFIFAGGSSSSAYEKMIRRMMTRDCSSQYPLRRRFQFALDIQGELMAWFIDVGTCMVPSWIQTSAIKATQAHFYAQGIVLIKDAICQSHLTYLGHEGLTWSSKHCVHSSRWTDWASLGWLRRVNCPRWLQTMVGFRKLIN